LKKSDMAFTGFSHVFPSKFTVDFDPNWSLEARYLLLRVPGECTTATTDGTFGGAVVVVVLWEIFLAIHMIFWVVWHVLTIKWIKHLFFVLVFGLVFWGFKYIFFGGYHQTVCALVKIVGWSLENWSGETFPISWWSDQNP
jgi:hypothetical protein